MDVVHIEWKKKDPHMLDQMLGVKLSNEYLKREMHQVVDWAVKFACDKHKDKQTNECLLLNSMICLKKGQELFFVSVKSHNAADKYWR